MMKDLGFGIEPGTRVDYFLIKPVKDTKNNIEIKVAPQQIFKLPYKEVAKFLKKRGIARLEFQLGQINSMKDIRQKVLRIDYDEYIKSLTGPGKISDRMIYSVARKQNVSLSKSDSISDQGLDSIIANTELTTTQSPESESDSSLEQPVHDTETENLVTQTVVHNSLMQKGTTSDQVSSKIAITSESITSQTLSKSATSSSSLVTQKTKKKSSKKNNSILNDLAPLSIRQKQSLGPEKYNFTTVVSSKKENTSLLNNFLVLEDKKLANRLVKTSNTRMNKILPKLNLYSLEKEKYSCDTCHQSYTNVTSYVCPHCNSKLEYEL